MTDLSVIQMTEEEFEQAEETIRVGLSTFIEVGQALRAVRDGGGYRLAGYSTFEDYCQERWDMRHQNADRLIRSAEVVAMLNPIGFTPANEAQARELAPLLQSDPESIANVWQEAIETAPNGKVTAAHVAEVVERHARPVPEPESRPMREAPLLRYCQDLPTPAIVSLMLRVFFPDALTALDLTYGSGNFWDGSAHVSVVAHDQNPERAPHGVADFTMLDYADQAFDVCLFDPPHIADAGEASVMGTRFSSLPDAELPDVIERGSREAWRVCRLGCIVKISEHIHGQRFQSERDWVRRGLDGLEPYDVVHQVRSGAFIDPKWEEQLSAYNNGSTYLIFRRGDIRHIRRQVKP